tara:strand:+ start:525 stop:1175 length:651 start_codon:yes stop_codon:yes gene_type:complete
MDHISINNLNLLKKEVDLLNKDVNIIAVSKTFSIEFIKPLISCGHNHFGENKVQEAIEKWTGIKKDFKNIKLHLIGKLQTNKVKFILPLFDYIHSLDSEKLAQKISLEQKKVGFKPKIFIQVNIGNEIQKNGIDKENLNSFLKICQKNYHLDIIGLMCIPPNNEKVEEYFKEMNELRLKNNLKELSMGMSNDFKIAIENKATFIRVGSKIFGPRNI